MTQALVGDKTIHASVCDDKGMYWSMETNTRELHHRTEAWHCSKMIRFITMTLGGEGDLNFMGNVIWSSRVD